ELLQRRTSLIVATATDNTKFAPGHVYVAPADLHLLIIEGYIRVGLGPRENSTRPAIDPLFRSVALGCGSKAIGVLLSGFLNDGADGLAAIKRCGGITLVQNPTSAVISDMPLNALGACNIDYRDSPTELAAIIRRLLAEDIEVSVPDAADIKLEVDI